MIVYVVERLAAGDPLLLGVYTDRSRALQAIGLPADTQPVRWGLGFEVVETISPLRKPWLAVEHSITPVDLNDEDD